MNRRKLSSKLVLAGPRGRGELSGGFPRFHLEKSLDGGQRLEDGEYVGRFTPNTVEARDRSAGLLEGSTVKSALFVYFWLCWVFLAARRLSLVAACGGGWGGGLPSRCGIAVVCLVVEHRL